MAGYTPDEAEVAMGSIVLKRLLTDRDANLELGLFTNVAPDETITHAAITEPTGAGYARINLVDANWTAVGSVFSYAQQTFTGGVGGWAGAVRGYFIATKAAGGTKRLLAVEIDAGGPYTINEADTYKVTPSLTFA